LSDHGQRLIPQSVNIALVSITPITADLLRYALGSEDNLHVTACVKTTGELHSLLALSPPDITLVGARKGSRVSTALPFLELTTAIAPQVRQIVMATDMADEDTVAFFPRGGARSPLRVPNRHRDSQEVRPLRKYGPGMGECAAA
jgi:hypothetical protein